MRRLRGGVSWSWLLTTGHGLVAARWWGGVGWTGWTEVKVGMALKSEALLTPDQPQPAVVRNECIRQAVLQGCYRLTLAL